MKNTRKISLIVIHCSATRVTQDFTFEKLEACHLARGFRSIGYHYYITKDGVIYPGRPESEIGAHARHFNAHSIGPVRKVPCPVGGGGQKSLMHRTNRSDMSGDVMPKPSTDS